MENFASNTKARTARVNFIARFNRLPTGWTFKIVALFLEPSQFALIKRVEFFSVTSV